ncbi:hypothetical protein T261_8215 [Streptomyces lydicus]|nr:hypothetical protein T261_8215 [Streptomyces lydicus]
MREPVQSSPDQLPVLVVTEFTDRGTSAREVIAGTLEVAEPSVDIPEVEVQRRIENRDRPATPPCRARSSDIRPAASNARKSQTSSSRGSSWTSAIEWARRSDGTRPRWS